MHFRPSFRSSGLKFLSVQVFSPHTVDFRVSGVRFANPLLKNHQHRPGTDVMILKIFLPKKLAFLTQNKAKLCKILIITLIFKKNAIFSPKIVSKNEDNDRCRTHRRRRDCRNV
jgi:hypothetical protein